MKILKHIESALEKYGHLFLLATLLLMIVASPFIMYRLEISWLLAILLVLILLAAAATVATDKTT